jgi:hypothetical protein
VLAVQDLLGTNVSPVRVALFYMELNVGGSVWVQKYGNHQITPVEKTAQKAFTYIILKTKNVILLIRFLWVMGSIWLITLYLINVLLVIVRSVIWTIKCVSNANLNLYFKIVLS